MVNGLAMSRFLLKRVLASIENNGRIYCYLSQYLSVETVSCRLFPRIVRMVREKAPK